MALALVALGVMVALVAAGVLTINMHRGNQAYVAAGVILGAVGLLGTMVGAFWVVVEVAKAVQS